MCKAHATAACLLFIVHAMCTQFRFADKDLFSRQLKNNYKCSPIGAVEQIDTNFSTKYCTLVKEEMLHSNFHPFDS